MNINTCLQQGYAQIHISICYIGAPSGVYGHETSDQCSHLASVMSDGTIIIPLIPSEVAVHIT